MNEISEFNAIGKPIHWKLGILSEIQMTTKTDYKFKDLSVKVAKEVVSLDLSVTETEQMIEGTDLIGYLSTFIPLNDFHVFTSALIFFCKAGPGRHLSPQEFHDILSYSRDRRERALLTVGTCPGIDVADKESVHLEHVFKEQELILLDVRNYYETRVGRFQLQDHSGEVVGSAIDPMTRQVQNAILNSSYLE
jgi:hypothetical protein